MWSKTAKRERDKLVSLSYFNPKLHKDLPFALLFLTVMSKSFMTLRPPNISYRSNWEKEDGEKWRVKWGGGGDWNVEKRGNFACFGQSVPLPFLSISVTTVFPQSYIKKYFLTCKMCSARLRYLTLLFVWIWFGFKYIFSIYDEINQYRSI